MKQYETWWVQLPDPIGTRPVILLSRDAAYEYLNRFLPQEVALGPREGMPQRCVANLDNLRAVPKAALQKRAGRLGARRVEELKRALGYALGWTELTTS